MTDYEYSKLMGSYIRAMRRIKSKTAASNLFPNIKHKRMVVT